MTNQQIISKLESLDLFLRTHPDCVPNSEMRDRLIDVTEIQASLTIEQDEPKRTLTALNNAAKRCFLERDQDPDSFYEFSGRLKEAWSDADSDLPF